MVEEEGHGDLVTADIRLRKQASSRSCVAAHHEQVKRESEREKERRNEGRG